jgi:hypothetical protein
MITANEARKLSDEILKPINCSPEFKAIMNKIEHKIKKAIMDGLEKIKIISYTLPILNDYKFPKGINTSAIDRDHFWWPYVKTELENNGFKIFSTITSDHYVVAW